MSDKLTIDDIREAVATLRKHEIHPDERGYYYYSHGDGLTSQLPEGCTVVRWDHELGENVMLEWDEGERKYVRAKD